MAKSNFKIKGIIFSILGAFFLSMTFIGYNSPKNVNAQTGAPTYGVYLPLKNARCLNYGVTYDRFNSYYYSEAISLNFLTGGLNGYSYIYYPSNNSNGNDVYSNTTSLQNLYSGYETSLRYSQGMKNIPLHEFIIEDSFYNVEGFNAFKSAIAYSDKGKYTRATIDISYYTTSHDLDVAPTLKQYHSSCSSYIDSNGNYRLYFRDLFEDFEDYGSISNGYIVYFDSLSIKFYVEENTQTSTIFTVLWSTFIEPSNLYLDADDYPVLQAPTPTSVITSTISDIFNIELFKGFRLSTFFFLICGATVLGLGFKIIFGG